MGGEQIPRSRDAERDLEGLSGLLHVIAGPFQYGKRRMTFIEMAHLRLDSESPQQSPTGDPEQQFLLQAQFRSAAIQLAGDAAMDWIIRGVIAVQQVQLYPTDLNLPSAQPDRVAGQGDLQSQPFAVRLTQGRDGQLPRIVKRIYGLLGSILVDHLTKVTLAIEQSDANDRHAQIAGSLQLVAGDVAEPTGVDGQRFAQHELHAEIGNTAQPRLRMGGCKPSVRLRDLSTALHQIGDVLAERRIGERPLERFLRYRLQYDPRVAREIP